MEANDSHTVRIKVFLQFFYSFYIYPKEYILLLKIFGIFIMCCWLVPDITTGQVSSAKSFPELNWKSKKGKHLARLNRVRCGAGPGVSPKLMK